MVNFGSSPSESAAALSEPLDKEASQGGNSTYCPPSLSTDANIGYDKILQLTAPLLTSSSTLVLRSPSPRMSSSAGADATPVGDLRNTNLSITEFEGNNNLSNGSQSGEANLTPIITPNNTYTVPAPDFSEVNTAVSPAKPSRFDPISPIIGPETKTLITKIEASRVLFSAHGQLDKAAQLATKAQDKLMECKKDSARMAAEEKQSEWEMKKCDKAIAEAKQARKEAWNKYISSPSPFLRLVGQSTAAIQEAIAVKSDLCRLYSLECDKCVERLKAMGPLVETHFSNRIKSILAHQANIIATREVEEAEDALLLAKRSFEEAWTKISSIKEEDQ